MSRGEALEQEIEKLSPQELADFREWFARLDADAWDRKLEAAAKAGKLDAIAEDALADYTAGRTREL